MKGSKLSFGQIEKLIIQDKEGNLHDLDDLEQHDFNMFMSHAYIRLYAFYREKQMPKLLIKKANEILESNITKALNINEETHKIIPIKKAE